MNNYSRNQVNYIRACLAALSKAYRGFPELSKDINEWCKERKGYADEEIPKEDSLRRFCSEKTEPSTTRLNTIVDYLISREILEPNLLQAAESSLAEAQLISSFLNTLDASELKNHFSKYYRCIQVTENDVYDCICKIEYNKGDRFIDFSALVAFYKNVPTAYLKNWNIIGKQAFKERGCAFSGWLTYHLDQSIGLFFTNENTSSEPYSGIRFLTKSNIDTLDFSILEPPSLGNNKSFTKKLFCGDFLQLSGKEEFDKICKIMRQSDYKETIDDKIRFVASNTTNNLDFSQNYLVNLLDNADPLANKECKHVAEERTSKLSKYNLGEQFLQALAAGETDAAKEYLDNGGDINYEDPESKARAIHIACEDITGNQLNWLIQYDGIEYNVRNRKGFLPSHLSAMSDHPCELTAFLIRKEAEEKLHFN